MSDSEPADQERTAAEPHRRLRRAACQKMTVYPLGGDIYSVTSESGHEYRVCAREGRCTCPNQKHDLADGKE